MEFSDILILFYEINWNFTLQKFYSIRCRCNEIPLNIKNFYLVKFHRHQIFIVSLIVELINFGIRFLLFY